MKTSAKYFSLAVEP